MARKRLNTKLLITLACGVAILAVAAFFGVEAYRENPERAITRAQQLEAAGEWEEAAGQWNRAYRRTRDSQYQLRGIEAIARLTATPEGAEHVDRIRGGLNGLVASDPGNLNAVRPLMRFYVDDSGFGQAGGATREVRRLAGLILAKEPEDPEARTFKAITTLALASELNEGITPEDAEAAHQELTELVKIAPLDGIGLRMLRVQFSREYSAAPEDRTQRQQLLEGFLTTVDAAATAADDMTPREGTPTDVAKAHLSISEAYEVLQGEVVRLTGPGEAPPADSSASASAVDENAATPLSLPEHLSPAALAAKATRHLEAAVAALDEKRDVLTEAYREVMVRRANRAADPVQIEQLLQALIQKRPWDVLTVMPLTQFYESRGNYTQAVEPLRGVYALRNDPLPLIPGTEGADARTQAMFSGMYLADALLDQRRLDRESQTPEQQRKLLEDARAAFGDADSRRKAAGYGEPLDSRRIQAKLQYAQGQRAESLRSYESALRTAEQTSGSARTMLEILQAMVQIHRDEKQSGAELEYLQRVIAFNDQQGRSSPMEQLRRSELLIPLGRTTEAREELVKLLEAYPNLLPAQELLAQIGNDPEVLARFNAMPEETSEQLGAKLRIASRGGMTEQVRSLLEKLVAKEPQNALVAINLAQLMLNDGEQEQATELLERYPNSVQARQALAHIRGDTQGVLDLMDPFQRLFAEAQIAEANEDIPLLIAKLEQARDLKPEDRGVLETLFRAYLHDRSFDKADPIANKLRTANADGMGGETYAIRLLLARAKPPANPAGETDAERSERQQQLTQAVAAAERLAASNGQLVTAVRLRGEALVASGQHEQAVIAYKRALELNPNDIQLVTALTQSLIAAKRAQEARELLESQLALRPEDPQLLAAKASYEFAFGDPAPVLDRLRKAVADNPQSVAARNQLIAGLAQAARSVGQRSDIDAARALLVQAVDESLTAYDQTGGEPDFLKRLAEIAPVLSDPQLADAKAKATALFDRLMLSSTPDAKSTDPVLVASASQFYASSGQMDKSESVIRRYVASIGDADAEVKAGALIGLSQVLAAQGKVEQAVSVLDGYQSIDQVQTRRMSLLAAAAGQRLEAMPDALDRLRLEVEAATSAGRTLPVSALNAAAAAELDVGDLGRSLALAQEAGERPAITDAEKAANSYLRGIIELRRPTPDLTVARDFLAAAVEGNGANLEARRNLARAQFLLGNRDAGKATLNALLQQAATDVSARLTLIQMAMSELPPNYGEAERHFREVDTAGVSNVQLLLARSRMELQRKDSNNAIFFAERAEQVARSQAAQNPTLLPNVIRERLRILTDAKRYTPALAAADTAIVESGSEWWLLEARGKALAGLNRTAEATTAFTEAYTKAAAISPQFAADVLLEMARRIGVDPAYALIQQQVETPSPEPEVLLLASRLALEKQDMTRAIELTEQVRTALEAKGSLLPSQQAQLTMQVGTLQLQTTPPRIDEAIESFRKVLNEPGVGDVAANNLAYALSLRAEAPQTSPEDALAMLREANTLAERAYNASLKSAALSTGRANVNVADSYAWVRVLLASRTNDTEGLNRAIADLQAVRDEAEASNTQFPEIFYHLARAHDAAGNGEQARQAVDRGFELLAERAADPQVSRPADAETRSRLEAMRSRLAGQPASVG